MKHISTLNSLSIIFILLIINHIEKDSNLKLDKIEQKINKLDSLYSASNTIHIDTIRELKNKTK